MVIAAGSGWEEITMITSKTLLGAAVAVVIAMPAMAQAQCSYRMNDVGRSHGYLSGPCNGAAQGYSGAYPSRGRSSSYGAHRGYDATGRPTNVHITHGNVTTGGGFTTIRNGNQTRTYDANGRLARTGIRRGNTVFFYDRKGRHTSTGILDGNGGGRLYDTKGRYSGSVARTN
jgi:hypothetical protein